MAITTLPCTHVKVRQLMRRLDQHYDGEVAACGLKTTQYSLLSSAMRSGPVRSVDLAAQLRMTPSTLSRNLRPLIAQGYVELQAGDDARCHLVVVTPVGAAKVEAARGNWRCAQQALQARLGTDRVKQLHALIDDAMAMLDAPSD